MTEKEILGKLLTKTKNIKLRKITNRMKWLFYAKNNNYNKQKNQEKEVD